MAGSEPAVSGGFGSQANECYRSLGENSLMQERLPNTFRSIRWSYDFDGIDPLKQRKTIIVQAINYGTLVHWRRLIERYGRGSIREVLSAVPATAIRPSARHLASLMFWVDRFNCAPRGTLADAGVVVSPSPHSVLTRPCDII